MPLKPKPAVAKHKEITQEELNERNNRITFLRRQKIVDKQLKEQTRAVKMIEAARKVQNLVIIFDTVSIK